jgi:signal transduction histidine kinase
MADVTTSKEVISPTGSKHEETYPQQAKKISAKPSDVSQIDFIQDIRIERLNMLWIVTLIAVIILGWATLFLATNGTTILDVMIPIVVVSISSIATRISLRRRQYQIATWFYALGMVFAVSTLMIPDDDFTRTYIPFMAVIIIFIVGLLMTLGDTFILLGISYVVMLGVPFLATEGDYVAVEPANLFAYVLMFIAAGLVVLVSGELYSIAQWAMDSYRKERNTATELHLSQQELEKSFLKQRNLTEQLQEINAELDEARKSAEVAKSFRGQFLANMSHELRTPLNAVIGFSETMLNFPMMYNDIELPQDYRKDLNQIYASGKHLLNIINDILDLSKIDAGRLEVEIQAVDLEPIFKSLLSTAVGLIGGKPVELRKHLPDDLPKVMGDPLRVRQILLNLYSNAAKFTDKGYITLHLSENHGSNEVIISVEDTGPGIPSEDQERIFEAFQQGSTGRKQQRAGSGLGLAICQQLVTLMKGRIWLDSQLGRGSTFYVALPRYAKPDTDADWKQVDPAEEVRVNQGA